VTFFFLKDTKRQLLALWKRSRGYRIFFVFFFFTATFGIDSDRALRRALYCATGALEHSVRFDSGIETLGTTLCLPQ
tara:strand:+ start:11753 stop:11983 length:231 start_codon:yes stop_codon:yes gene_type:complete